MVNGYCLAGSYTVSWNAEDHTGRQNAGDIYLLRLQAEDYTKTVKMMYIQ